MPVEIENADEIGAGFAIVCAVAVFVSASLLPAGPNPGDPGPAFFPQIIAIFTIVLSLFIILKNRVKGGGESVSIELTKAKMPLLILTLLVTYVLVMPWVGFIPSTIGFLAITMRISEVQNYRKAMAISVGMVLVLYYVFAGVFHIRLPETPLLPFHVLGWRGGIV